MKKCPFCAEDIQDEAVKCKHCGEFLDSPSKPKPTKTEDDSFDVGSHSRLPCAFCGTISTCEAKAQDIQSGGGSLRCSKCSMDSQFIVRKVRSKSSKQQSQNRQVVGRHLSFRLRKPNGEEEHIEFESGGPDIEAKSGDMLAFLSYERKWVMVLNLTVGNFMNLTLPIDLEIARIQKEILAIKVGPAGQGCAGGCLVAVLGVIMSAILNTPGNSGVAEIVGFSALAAPVIGPMLTSSIAQSKPDNIEKTKQLEARLEELKAFKS